MRRFLLLLTACLCAENIPLMLALILAATMIPEVKKDHPGATNTEAVKLDQITRKSSQSASYYEVLKGLCQL